MRYQKWFFGAVLVLGLLASTTSAALEPTFTTIDPPGSVQTLGGGINNRGQIVGRYFPRDARFLLGYVLDHGTFTTIDVPGGTSSDTTQAFGINDRGQIVGTFRVAGQGIHGFLLD